MDLHTRINPAYQQTLATYNSALWAAKQAQRKVYKLSDEYKITSYEAELIDVYALDRELRTSAEEELRHSPLLSRLNAIGQNIVVEGVADLKNALLFIEHFEIGSQHRSIQRKTNIAKRPYGTFVFPLGERDLATVVMGETIESEIPVLPTAAVRVSNYGGTDLIVFGEEDGDLVNACELQINPTGKLIRIKHTHYRTDRYTSKRTLAKELSAVRQRDYEHDNEIEIKMSEVTPALLAQALGPFAGKVISALTK